MLDHAIEKDRARQVFYDLVNVDCNSTGRVFAETDWIDMRIDNAPLARPVSADAFMPMDHATFHAVGPNYVRCHGGESAIDITRIEGGVGPLQ